MIICKKYKYSNRFGEINKQEIIVEKSKRNKKKIFIIFK